MVCTHTRLFSHSFAETFNYIAVSKGILLLTGSKNSSPSVTTLSIPLSVLTLTLPVFRMLVTSPWAFWLVCLDLVIDPIDAVTANAIVKTDPTSLDARPTLAKNWSSIVSKGSTVFSACTRIPGCGRTSISVHTVIPSLEFRSLKFLSISFGLFRQS